MAVWSRATTVGSTPSQAGEEFCVFARSPIGAHRHPCSGREPAEFPSLPGVLGAPAPGTRRASATAGATPSPATPKNAGAQPMAKVLEQFSPVHSEGTARLRHRLVPG